MINFDTIVYHTTIKYIQWLNPPYYLITKMSYDILDTAVLLSINPIVQELPDKKTKTGEFNSVMPKWQTFDVLLQTELSLADKEHQLHYNL